MKISRNDAVSQYTKAFLITSLSIGALFGVLVLRLLYIQLWQGQTYRNLSENNRIRILERHALRGRIMDANREDLAENRPSFHVTAIPEEVQNFEVLQKTLAEISPLPEDALKKKFEELRKAIPFRAYTLWKDANWETMAYLEANRLRIPGVVIQVNQTRDYLYGDLLAHLLGYIGEINAEELKQDQGKYYRMGDSIGKTGIEAVMEERLRGNKGGVQVEVDARGRQIHTLLEKEPVPGTNVVLHIDRQLQETARDAMEGQTGTVIAADTRNGNILCYVSLPSYDPNLFVTGIPLGEWQSLQRDPHHPLTNRGIQGCYPPGSVFKIIMAIAAMEEGLVTPGERIFCNGSHNLGRSTFRCWKKHGHGWVDFHRALVESCDVYFYQMGQRLGIRRIADYAQRFGLGSKTGIEMGGERSGLIPTPEWKKRRFGEPWYEGETLSVSIGQGAVAVTPLQLLMMTCAVANGKRLWTPSYIKQMEYPDGRIYWAPPPQQGDSVPLSERTMILVHEALRDVVNSGSGTGRAARLQFTNVAGKTGTAQVVRLLERGTPESKIPWEQRDHAWFVSYAPAEKPEIAVVVLVEHGGHGGSKAAPVAKKVLQKYFELKNETGNQG